MKRKNVENIENSINFFFTENENTNPLERTMLDLTRIIFITPLRKIVYEHYFKSF